MDGHQWLKGPGLFALLLGGCGGGDDDRPQARFVPFIYADAPAEYALDDEACQRGGAPSEFALTSSTVHALKGQQVVPLQVALTGLVSGDSLKSPAVAKTTWGEEYLRSCDYTTRAGRDCLDDEGQPLGWVRTQAGSPLRVCSRGRTYNRESYEGVALTSLYHIQKADFRYRALAEPRADLPKITLSVLPHFIDEFEHYQINGNERRLRRYITGNMAYFNTPAMIAVFPEDAATHKEDRAFLWESAFVLGHEYGHHIDFARNRRRYQSIGLKWDPAIHGFADLKALNATGNAYSDRSAIVGAAAEAFADLLAYYAEGGSSLSLIGLPCFGVNRDISLKSFANGDDKVLTEDRLSLLLGYSKPDLSDCGTPNYQDIHVAGAILAVTLDEVFSRLTEAVNGLEPGEASDFDRRYQLALQWNEHFAKALGEQIASPTGAQVLQPFVDATERLTVSALAGFRLRTESADGDPDHIRADLCRLVQTRLPVLPDMPFANHCHPSDTTVEVM